MRAGGGREATAVLAQPKRLALLAYLAAAAPYGFHRRDILLALFWPEADQNRARSALRQATHFLRHELGTGVIANRGDEDLGLVEERVWCDVREFDRLLADGQLALGLTLYRGDLLPGYFIGDAPDFERWLEEERDRLRARAAEAAWALADRLEGETDTDEAARWARWACALTPDDERMVRRLVGLLARVGDRAGAIRAYEELAGRLDREYQVAPSAELRSLIDAVRAGRVEAAAAPSAPGFARAPPARDSSRVEDAPPVHTTSREYIAVFPFPVHGDGSAAYLHEGLVDLLSTNLDHAGTLHSIDPHALLSLVGREGAGRLDSARAAELARRFGADLYVLGSVVGVAGHLRITAALHHRCPGPGTGSARFVSVAGPAEQLFDLVDDLSGKLLAELHSAPGARLSRLAATTTASLPALKAYLAGEKALRGGRYREAVEAFQLAVDHDPDFALAWYRLSFFLAWPTLPQPSSSMAAAERALAQKQRLSERDRQLLEALSASLAGAARHAEDIYRTLVAIHPEDVEAWLGLGQTLIFHNQQRGRLIVEARSAFERVLQLDPDHTTANLFLSYIAELEGNSAECDRRIAGSPQRSDFVHPRIVQAFRRGDRRAQEQAMAYLRSARDPVIYEATRFVATLTLDFSAAERIAHLLSGPGRSAEMHGIHHVLTAFLELAAGRAGAGWSELERAAPLLPAGALEYRGLVATLPFLPLETSAVEALRTTLADWNASAVPRSAHPHPAFDLHHKAYPVLRLYLLGALSARLGDAGALEYAAELDGVSGNSDVEPLARDLAHSVRARVAAVQGDAATALGWLDRSRGETRCMLIVLQSPFYTRTAERWLRAELLHRLGRNQEALRWYQSIAQASLFDLIYLAPSHLRRAEIHERLGDRKRAAEHYRRVIELWGGCDPILRPSVEEAAGRLERQGGGGGGTVGDQRCTDVERAADA